MNVQLICYQYTFHLCQRQTEVSHLLRFFFYQILYHVISVERNVMQKDRSIGNDDDHDIDDDGDDKEALGKEK